MSKALEIFNSMKQHLHGNVADADGIMALVNGVNAFSRYAQNLERDRARLVEALRKSARPSEAGQCWCPARKRNVGHYAYCEANRALLHELGEDGS